LDNHLFTHFSFNLAYTEVPNRRTDRNKWAGLEKSATRQIDKQAGGNFSFIAWKIASRMERKSIGFYQIYYLNKYDD